MRNKKYFNIFLIHKRTNLILLEDFYVTAFNNNFYNIVYEAKSIFNQSTIDYNNLFSFLEKYSLLHDKLYTIIKRYILLPKKYKLFFYHFKFVIYPAEYTKYNQCICYLLNQFLNSYLFTYCIFPLCFNKQK
jgi:hypothetical protein